jgi:mono/diheme cytochrome c family protein
MIWTIRRQPGVQRIRLWVLFRLIVMALSSSLPLSLGLASVSAAQERVEPAGKVDYNREVRPILAKNCFACHGQDEAKRAKGLRLDRRESATQPLKNGETAVVPGDPESSELIGRITEEDETLRMPPKKVGVRLTPAEVELLRRWIAQGADYALHWAFVAPEARPIPKVLDKSWPRNAIDFWILDRLRKEGLKPSPEASRPVLLRRLSLDLRGLPPTL